MLPSGPLALSRFGFQCGFQVRFRVGEGPEHARIPGCTHKKRHVIPGPSRPHPCLPFASPSPARCCFLGTSFGEVPLLLAGFLLPLNCAPSVCALLRSMKTLSWTSSVKILTSVNRLISSGISTFVRLARMYLCLGDHVLGCSWLMCRSKSSSLKKKRSTPGQGMRKVFPLPPIPLSHRLGPINSRNTIHFQQLTLREFAPLPTRENCFAHRTRIGSRHRRDAKLQSMRATHFMCRC